MATGKTRPTPVGTGSTNIRAPTPTNRIRASHRNTVSLLLPRGEIMQQEYDVKDKESGAAFLEKSPFCRTGEPMTNESLILTILHITQYTGIPRIVIEGLRAVALLLEEGINNTPTTATELNIQQITDSLSTSLSAHVVANLTSSLSAHVVAAISPQVASILTASENLKTNVDEITKFKTTLEENSKDIKDIVDNASQSAKPQPGTPRSYSTVVQQNAQTPAPISAALARAATRDRQILFDPVPGSVLFATEVTSAEIATKMKQAFTASQSDDTPDIQIKAITRLRNGGFITELTTTEAAKWIRTPENRLKITNALDLPATIKERRFSIIVPFLPIASNIEDTAWLRTVEEENNMMAGAIESANWIKPRQRRAPTQRVAHAIFHFADTHSANNTLRDGIYIGQEKLHPRKDKREPVRCVRCQLWGHIAKDCKAPKDVCGTCGKNHRTNECNAYRTFHCVSCNSHEHASWDRKCPEFESKCAGIDAKHPENSMPYFPTDDPWTQVMLPPQPAPYRKSTIAPAPVSAPTRPSLYQTSLPYESRRPTRGYHSRGAPRHYGQRGSRAFTPTGPNSIPIVGTWNPGMSPSGDQRSQVPSNTTLSPIPDSPLTSSSIYATPRPPSPLNV